MKIVTLTLNPALDKSTHTPFVTPEKKLRCSELRMDAGGGGINVSKGLKRLKGTSTAVFPVGGDSGKLLKSLLREAGITTKTVAIEGSTRENLSVSDETTGHQYRFTLPGGELSLESAAACLEAVRSLKPDLVVASGSLPPGLPENYYGEVAKACTDMGAKLVLDTSGKPLAEAAASQQCIYLIKPNLGELSTLVGASSLEMNQIDDAARSLIAMGKCEVVVVSLGAAGAVLVTKDFIEHVPAPTVLSKTTVGAGDSMVAGMVWALSRKKRYGEMLRMGVACGSAATMNQGSELFFPDDVWRLMDWIKTYSPRQRFTDF